jgi:deoxycytidine triphosphate deaminase
MTILDRQRLIAALRRGDIVCNGPVPPTSIQGAQIDVRLGAYAWLPSPDDLRPFRLHTDDQRERMFLVRADANGELVIPPFTFALACTEEFIGTRWGSGLIPEFKMRSTPARGGVLHGIAAWGDEGFAWRWALELFNAMPFPLVLCHNERIGSMIFHRITRLQRLQRWLKGERSGYKGYGANGRDVSQWRPAELLMRRGNMR